MKKITILFTLLTVLTISRLGAQNLVQVNFGISVPKGVQLRSAFGSAETIGGNFLHRSSNPRWLYGAGINHQRFFSKDSAFGAGNSNRITINNLLFSLRKEFHLRDDHNWYLGFDAGLNQYAQRTIKAGTGQRTSGTGYTTALALGTTWKLSKCLSFNFEGNVTYSHTDDLNYNDRFTTSLFKFYGLRFGLQYGLSK